MSAVSSSMSAAVVRQPASTPTTEIITGLCCVVVQGKHGLVTALRGAPRMCLSMRATHMCRVPDFARATSVRVLPSTLVPVLAVCGSAAPLRGWSICAVRHPARHTMCVRPGSVIAGIASAYAVPRRWSYLAPGMLCAVATVRGCCAQLSTMRPRTQLRMARAVHLFLPVGVSLL